MHKIDGAGHLGNMFVMEDALLNRPPTEITADFMNALQLEISNVIEWAEIILNKGDNTQLLQALQAKFASINPAADYATKSAVQFDDYKIADADVVGAPDAIVASFFPAISALASSHGMTLYVRALAANATTIPSFTPNQGAIAAKPIVKGNNLPLVAGDIAGAGYWMELQYDLTIDKWVLRNPAKGIDSIPFASNSQAAALLSTNTMLSPATLAYALGMRVGHIYAANDWAPLPGGLILQWGSIAANFNESDINVTFATTFPNVCFLAVPIISMAAAVGGSIGPVYKSSTNSGAVFIGDHAVNPGSGTLYYIAIGR